MSNVHAALPTEVKRIKTRMYLRPIRGRSRWPRGQRVADGAPVGNSLALGLPAREWPVQISGRSDLVGGGAFPKWFSQTPYYLFELFALEGFIFLAHMGWLLWPPEFGLGSGLLTEWTPSPSPLDKPSCALDHDSPLGFAVILSSQWGKAGLCVDFRGSSFDGPS